MQAHDITTHPLHLGLGATAETEPLFTGAMDWYADYANRHVKDGAEGRLVSMHTFSAPWDVWEMHPHGSEVVICISGSMVLHQQGPNGSVAAIELGPNQYAINAPGVWHTADIDEQASAVFITAGLGTQHRPR